MTYNRGAVAGGFLVGIILLTAVLQVKFYFFPPADVQPLNLDTVVTNTTVPTNVNTSAVTSPTITPVLVTPQLSTQPVMQFVQTTVGGAGVAPNTGSVTATDATHSYTAVSNSTQDLTLTVSSMTGQLQSQQHWQNMGSVVSLIPDATNAVVLVSQTTDQLLFSKIPVLGDIQQQAALAWTEPVRQVVRDNDLLYIIQAKIIAVLSDNLSIRYPDITLSAEQLSPAVTVTDSMLLVTYTKVDSNGGYNLYTDEYIRIKQ